MNQNAKTKKELIVELQELQQKYQSLKKEYDKNIAGRKQADLDLQTSEERLREINKTDWVWEVDEKGVYTYTSQTGIDMFGSLPEDVIGKTPFDFMPPEEKERVATLFAEIIEKKAPIKDMENWVITKDGELRCVLTNGVPILDEKGNLKGYRGVDRDITERKKAEAEIKRMNEELLISNAEKDKFFSIIAHDLRSPFNSFLGLTQVMAENLQDLTMEEIRKFSLTMRDSVSHLYRLLENLLQWSRMQQGMILFNPEIIPLCSIIIDSLDILAEPAQAKEIEITCAIPNNLEVFADVNVVQTIIRNLVSNAIKFTPRGGKVDITANLLPDRFIEISVADTGIGMDREMLDKLFRLDGKVNREGTEGETSTGLGLILCKEFIEKQGGKLWVESEVGKGSVFYFTLPFAEESEKRNLGENGAIVSEPDDEDGNLKVLIVEDDETSELIISIAAKMFGNEIALAKTGEDAVIITRGNPDIDLILMDVQIPGLDGYETTRQIREFNKDVIIIALTGFGFTGEREKAIQAGCNDYFSKPVNKYKLKAVRQKYFSK
ncbi:ATP-binding protein [Prolixibacter denitrificans]|uniref:histidine kinase n=1 Tax=Prolixibacter denitrificans TaxID=1541063 RepID=A0A2P8C6Z5_9BACT|nr:ATP-binding protein [Prolixibacter denitrificans]PSK80726.1 PAS domain S-box-containing protein [Prolixibacter denitrificans]GET22474.1 hypothetical protein JCM18694_27200 [Prolixibacter denitrificans]